MGEFGCDLVQESTHLSNQRKIIVLTPVKNEAEHLDRFIKVTSKIADVIIFADQSSTDNSPQIIQSYPKTVLIKNQSTGIDNASRQLLLINEARNHLGYGNILIALDVDEIISANVIGSDEWKNMMTAPTGTVLYFEKPDLYENTCQCIRFSQSWPLGYIDDGAEHRPTQEHSIRIPTPIGHTKFEFSEVKILHYALTRVDAQYSKVRLYSIRENLSQRWNVIQRRRFYSQSRDYSQGGQMKNTEGKWFKGWEKIGIDMHSTFHKQHYWYDLEVLHQLMKHGSRRFYWDDIWNKDWEKFRVQLLNKGASNISANKIKQPGVFYIVIGVILDKLDAIQLRLKSIIGK